MVSGFPPVQNILHGIVLNTTTSFKISGSVAGFWWVFKSEGKKAKKLSLNLSKNILLPPVNKICDKSGNGNAIQDSLLHTRTETPTLFTLLQCPAPSPASWCTASLSMALSPQELGINTHSALLSLSQGEGSSGCFISPSHPLHLMVFSTAPVSAPASFLPFLKNFLKEVSIHWLFLSHIPLNPQPTAIWLYNSWFPLPVTISVDSRKTSLNSSILLEICFSDMFVFAKLVLDTKLLVWPPHFSQCLLHLSLVRTLR